MSSEEEDFEQRRATRKAEREEKVLFCWGAVAESAIFVECVTNPCCAFCALAGYFLAYGHTGQPASDHVQVWSGVAGCIVLAFGIVFAIRVANCTRPPFCVRVPSPLHGR